MDRAVTPAGNIGNGTRKHPGFKLSVASLLRFRSRRQKIYGGLLLFVIAVGTPISIVPSLRNRLWERTLTLKAAAQGKVKPVSLEVAGFEEPFPAEFEKPVTTPPSPVPIKKVGESRPAVPGGSAVQAPGSKVSRIWLSGGATLPPSTGTESAQSTRQTDLQTAGEDEEVKYQRGALEAEAYQILIERNSTIAGMIQNGRPPLRFKSWDAASRGDNIYWVRIKFQTEENAEVDYIWQVNLETRQARPLNFNARTLP